MERNRALLAILRILILAALGLVAVQIWRFSLETSTLSAMRSQQVLAWLNQWVRRFHLTIRPTEAHVRKLAHFAEYALLGLLLQTLFWSFSRLNPHTALHGLFLGLLIAVADETLQVFSVGRGAAVTDVVLDFAGLIVGATVLWTLRGLILLMARLVRRAM